MVCHVPNRVWAGLLDQGSLSALTSVVGHTGCDGAESGSVMWILLGTSLGEAESPGTLLGANALGLRSWTRKRNHCLRGFARAWGNISSPGFQINYPHNQKNSKRMRLSECECQRWDAQSFALAGVVLALPSSDAQLHHLSRTLFATFVLESTFPWFCRCWQTALSASPSAS